MIKNVVCKVLGAKNALRNASANNVDELTFLQLWHKLAFESIFEKKQKLLPPSSTDLLVSRMSSFFPFIPLITYHRTYVSSIKSHSIQQHPIQSHESSHEI